MATAPPSGDLRRAPNPQPPPARTAPDTELRALTTLAKVLDAGVDPLLGLLLPGVGDLIGTLLGSSLVASAVRRRLPVAVIARMVANLAIDAAVGAVPLLGDVFDFGFRANRKNLTLLTERADTRKATAKDWAYLLGALALLITVLVAVVWVGYRVAAWAC